MEIIRNAADPKCSAHLENSIKTIDAILSNGRLKGPLKRLFGLEDLRHDDDFASVIEVLSPFHRSSMFLKLFLVSTGQLAGQVLAPRFRVD